MPYLCATPILFLMGASLAYFVVIPYAFKFFVSFETPGTAGSLPIEIEAKVNEYLSLVMTLLLAFGVAFQLPVLLTLMARAGLITSQGLISKWRYAVVGMFGVAAVLTPPDVVSQTSLAVPLILLYILSIFSCKWVEKQRAKREAEEEAELAGNGDAPAGE
jgi:sec-independent protein translocase protein TatC